ncbi:flagellar protein FlaG [Desulfovibrio sp. Huiquan2017]|uniref:flagellar protein FlaG n=1 Tax=Desulfovibrio sp. Huiquan2017 TaxID=2816861 RepID=UPI001A9108AE|nr:flagellar protein FlaG [Desulfovibrio sp. Huiquan2017]
MNFPMMNIDRKEELRSESVGSAAIAQKPPAREWRNDEVMAQDETQSDKQSDSFSREELENLISEAEEHLEAKNVKLKFNILENNDTVQVEIVDSNGKTIRKIPDDELIKLTKSLKDLGQGFLDRMS